MHLPQCESCRTVAGEAGEVLSYLGAAVEQLDPPPSLRDRLMAAVAETPQANRCRRPRRSRRSAARATTHRSRPPPRRRRAGRSPSASGGRARFDPPAGQPARPGLSLVPARPPAGGRCTGAGRGAGHRCARRAQRPARAPERDAQIAQAQSLENLLDEFDRPGVQHALLAREDGSTIAAVVVGRAAAGVPDRDAGQLGRPRHLRAVGDRRRREPGAAGNLRRHRRRPGAAGGRWARRRTEDYAAYAISLEPGRTAPAVPTAVVAPVRWRRERRGVVGFLPLRAISSGGERFVHTEEVTGSIPVSPTAGQRPFPRSSGGASAMLNRRCVTN